MWSLLLDRLHLPPTTQRLLLHHGDHRTVLLVLVVQRHRLARLPRKPASWYKMAPNLPITHGNLANRHTLAFKHGRSVYCRLVRNGATLSTRAPPHRPPRPTLRRGPPLCTPERSLGRLGPRAAPASSRLRPPFEPTVFALSTRLPSQRGRFQSDTATFQRNKGTFQTNTGAFQSNTRRFPINHGRFPFKRGRFPIKHSALLTRST